jgi:hypothetical protein
MSEAAENQAWVIPDFFYELIARMIPGLVAIAIFMYWSKSDFNKVVASGGAPVNEYSKVVSIAGLSVFGLVAGWVIGVTLDVGAYAIGKQFFPELQKEFAPDVTPSLEVVQWLSDTDRKIMTKQTAVKILFRNMMVICALTGVICQGMCFWPEWHLWVSFLPGLHDHYVRYEYLCWILAFVFWLCWKQQRSGLSSWWKMEEERVSKSSAAGGSPS